MQTAEGLRRKIHSAEELLSVVRTMKTLAAVSIRHYELAVEALNAYSHAVALGLQALLTQRPDVRIGTPAVDHGSEALVVFGTDQGLCGQFNERVVALAEELVAPGAPRLRVAAVGERCAGLLEEAGLPPETVFNVPSGIAGVGPLVQDLLFMVDDWQARDPLVQVRLVANQPGGGPFYATEQRQLLPVDRDWLENLAATPWRSHSLPWQRMSWRDLLAALIQQHLYVVLFQTLVESLASEDASRLAAMQNAERNIEERLADLHAAYHHRRQETITAELLDIVAGFEAAVDT
jgi:F-type H+-transporting ATPase subunit gamma